MNVMKMSAVRAAFLCGAAFIFAPGGVPVAAASDAPTAQEAARKINIAGRQRMLSQRMAKAACLMAQDVAATTAFDQMTQAFNLFQKSDTALRTGDAAMKLKPEKFPKVLNALSAIDEHWAVYKIVIENGIENASIKNDQLDAMDGASLRVLKFMNIAVFKTARAYAAVSAEVPLGLAITVDVAGRQRMLTQKAVKEACLMRSAKDPADHAARLAGTVELFDTSLKALQEGFADVGVIAPPTPELARELQKVGELWAPVKKILDRAAEGDKLSDRDLQTVARLSEPLLRTMNKAVGMYEK